MGRARVRRRGIGDPHTNVHGRSEVTLKRLLRAVLPGLLVVLALGAGLVLLDEEDLANVTDRYALVVYGAGAVLASVFHRSRVVIALLGLAYVEAALVGIVFGGARIVPLGTVLVALLGLLALLRDRGIRSRGGLLQLGASASLMALAEIVLRDQVAAESYAEVRALPAGLPAADGFSEATLLVGAGALACGCWGVFRWRGSVERALLWAQVLVLAALHPSVAVPEASLVLMAAGIVLSLSVIEQSYSMAYRDELTGLPGRRALMRDLAEAGGTYTVGMVDVDHFKKFNDTHGHDVGDQVLKLVATRLSASEEGRPYRYGGEEFTVLFPKLTRERALAPAEEVRAAVEKATFSLRSWRRPRKKPTNSKPKKKPKRRPRRLSVTVSIGLADSSDGDAAPEAILKRADQALYRAKGDGRNRVSL